MKNQDNNKGYLIFKMETKKFYNIIVLPAVVFGIIMAWDDINFLRFTVICYGIAGVLSFYYLNNFS